MSLPITVRTEEPSNVRESGVRRSGVVQGDVVLNVQIGSPVADLGRTLQGRNLHHRGAEEVVDGDVLLMLFDECCRCRWGNVVKGAIGYGRTRFCRDVIGRE